MLMFLIEYIPSVLRACVFYTTSIIFATSSTTTQTAINIYPKITSKNINTTASNHITININT